MSARGRALSVRGAVNVPLSSPSSESIDKHRSLPSKFVDLDVTDMGGLGALHSRSVECFGTTAVLGSDH